MEFGEELVHYAVGASSCAVPGVPAGLDALWRAHGSLPWPRLVEPALRLARDGVAMPAAHASCLAMLAPVMTMREGAASVYSGTIAPPVAPTPDLAQVIAAANLQKKLGLVPG